MSELKRQLRDAYTLPCATAIEYSGVQRGNQTNKQFMRSEKPPLKVDMRRLIYAGLYLAMISSHFVLLYIY